MPTSAAGSSNSPSSEKGWAEVDRYHDRTFRGLARYYALQAQAKAAGRGVWGQCGGDFHSDRE
jgi:hypothetical protein